MATSGRGGSSRESLWPKREVALQLRLFQTMGEIAVNQNSTIILPVPIDLIRPFLDSGDGTPERGAGRLSARKRRPSASTRRRSEKSHPRRRQMRCGRKENVPRAICSGRPAPNETFGC